MTKRRWAAAVLGALSVALAGVGLAATRSDGGPPPVAAIVGGEEIRSREVERLVDRWMERDDKDSEKAQAGTVGPAEDPERDRIFRENRGDTAKNALVYLIRVTFLEQLARQHGIPTELSGSDALLVKAMPEEGFVEGGWEKSDYQRGSLAGVLAKRLGEKIFADLVVPENELLKFFESNKKAFETSWQANIAVAYFDHQPAIEQFAASLRDGVDFESAARRIGAREAGTLSGLGPTAALPKPLLDAVSVLQPGELSRPFPVGSGWTVVLVTKRTDISARDFRAAKDEIAAILTKRKRQTLFTTWFDEQLVKAKVEVRHYGRWNSKYQLIS
jgi:hypothetical protein